MSTLLRGFPLLLLLFSAKKHIAFTKPTQTAAIFSTYYIIRATPPLGAQKTNAPLHHPKNPKKRITYSKKRQKRRQNEGRQTSSLRRKKTKQKTRGERACACLDIEPCDKLRVFPNITSYNVVYSLSPLGGARGGGCEAVGGVGGASGIGARKEKHINMKQDSNHATNFEPCGKKRLISDTL